jgi:predicted nucleic acid-binding protein
MPEFLDASVLLRYLTDSPPAMAEQAERLIESEAELRITETALAETAYVMRRVYGLAREEIVDLLIAFLQRSNILVHGLDKQTTIAALLLCRPSGRVSVGDALIWAAARSAGPSVVYSFDRRFPAEGIELRQP